MIEVPSGDVPPDPTGPPVTEGGGPGRGGVPLAVGSLRRTEVDGVPTIWTRVPGPLRAGLLLRMGSADETLPTSGVSHLLEHLALFGAGRPGDHSNGFVDHTTTAFHTVGDTAVVTAFLDQVTRQLSDLPIDRLEAERGVIEAEQAARYPGVVESLHTWRYGARGYGLAAQPQYGVSRLDAGTVRAWAARFAVRRNAVLWMSGPPPAGLRLHLGDGAFQPPPDPCASLLPRFPTWYPGRRDGVALLALVPRGWAAPALRHLLRSRLVDELRTARAVASSPDVDYRPLTGDIGRLVAVTDLVPGREEEGTHAFLDVLDGLGRERGEAGALTSADLAGWRNAADREAADLMAPLGAVMSSAWEILFGRPASGLDAQAGARARVTVPEVAELARIALSSALAELPPGTEPRDGTWRPAPVTMHPRLSGRRFRYLDASGPGARLVIGPEGATVQGRDGAYLTAAVGATAAVLRWPDGRRVLVAEDANRIDIEPTMWRAGAEAVAAVDGTWPADLAVDMPPRDPATVPRPSRSWVRGDLAWPRALRRRR